MVARPIGESPDPGKGEAEDPVLVCSTTSLLESLARLRGESYNPGKDGAADPAIVCSTATLLENVARLRGETSSRLFEKFADWNVALNLSTTP